MTIMPDRLEKSQDEIAHKTYPKIRIRGILVAMVELEIVRERFEPYTEPLVDAHLATVEKWKRLMVEMPEWALPLDATARAVSLHRHLSYEVEQRLDQLPRARVNDALDFFALLIDDDILLRFKYVGHGEPHNFPTRQQRLLARQTFTEPMTERLLGDASLTPPTLLTCGYTLDGDQLGRIEVRRDCKGHPPWVFDLYGGEATVEPLVLEGLADETKPATIRSKRTKPAERETG
jgi:hypothetical protein